MKRPMCAWYTATATHSLLEYKARNAEKQGAFAGALTSAVGLLHFNFHSIGSSLRVVVSGKVL